ncbi:MAG: sulfatase [Rubripirellula sp.]|jgi:arylsulfatase A-like enzyme
MNVKQLIILVSCCLFATSLAAAQRKNVLLICVDDLNDWVGCMGGHAQAKTPFMDDLAAQGTLFKNAHCQAPICGPSRASFLSGRYPHETGLYDQPRGKGKMIDDAEHFRGHLLPEYFSQHGYETLAAGKITHGYPLNKAVNKAGSSGNSGPKPKGPKPPNDVRFNYRPDYSQPYTGTQTDWAAFPDRDAQMPDFQTADWAIRQLEKDQSVPFFLAVGFHRPHVPFYVPQKWFDLHPLGEIIVPAIRDHDLQDVPETGVRVHELPRYPQLPWLRANDNEQLRKCTQAYLACTSFVDAQVGRVIQALNDSPNAENTIIVLFSDHGYHLGEKNRVSKHSLWEESTRVPLIIVEPGKRKPQTCTRPVGLIDLYPSLLELCGLPAREANSGRSLVPLLNKPNDPSVAWRESILTTYARGNHSLRSERFRYIRYYDGSEELYDHSNDPNEWSNLAQPDNRSHESVVTEFRSQLPTTDAEYHPAVGFGAVNPWFAEFYDQLEKDRLTTP